MWDSHLFAQTLPQLNHPAESAVMQSIAGDESEEMPNFNLDSPTLGGRQFWGDVLFFRGYRIQQHIVTRHYRLLDPNDIRRAWGTHEDCQAILERIKAEKQLPPMSGKAVLLIHGIIRSSHCFSKLAKSFEEEGYLVVGFDYPSTRAPLTDSAKYLERTLDSLKGIDQIDLVVHSMGGLLIRTYLQQAGENRDPRLHRLVMLGVPNQGARLANLFQKNWLFQMTFGPAGQQLIEDPEGFIAGLPAPDFEFAIVSGIHGTPDGWNPFIPGDDDGTVSLSATRLPGAADSIEIKTLHSAMMGNPQVVQATLNFMKTGSLRAEGERRPIPSISTSSEVPRLKMTESDSFPCSN